LLGASTRIAKILLRALPAATWFIASSGMKWCDRAEPAIAREKQLKKWNRAWKIRMIEETNPNWDDLYDALFA
jgi:hypothetical protein